MSWCYLKWCVYILRVSPACCSGGVLAPIEAVPNMAATQSESQQNEVNRESVRQEQSSISDNVSLQNGTERNIARSLTGFDSSSSKIKHASLNPEMSQYRQEPNVGPGIHNPDPSANSDEPSKVNHCGENKQFLHNSEQSDQSYGKGTSDGNSQAIPGYGGMPFPQRGNYHPEHPSSNSLQAGAEGNIHQSNFGPFNPQMRHGYSGSKPIPAPGPTPQRPMSPNPNMNPPGNFSPHMQQQRFLSGQSISQPTGPTPTLNQLLQASNPVHRYQNSYVDYNMSKQGGDQSQGTMPFNQGWPPRPMGPYSSQPGIPGYRPQSSMVSWSTLYCYI